MTMIVAMLISRGRSGDSVSPGGDPARDLGGLVVQPTLMSGARFLVTQAMPVVERRQGEAAALIERAVDREGRVGAGDGCPGRVLVRMVVCRTDWRSP